MAKAFFAAGAGAGNTYSSSLHESSALPGLIDHPSLSPDVQVAILGVVDDAVAPTVGDCIEALPGHPEPVTAIMALVRAGVLNLEPVPVIDANTRVERTASSSTPGDDGGEVSAGGGGSDCPPEVSPLPAGVNLLAQSKFVPQIYHFCDAKRSAPRRIHDLQRAGVYVGWTTDGQTAYVGTSEVLGRRVPGSHLAQREPDHVAVIVDRDGAISKRQGRVLERICYGLVRHAGGFVDLNDVPNGDYAGIAEYMELRHFMTDAALVLREAGLLFNGCSLRHLLAGPKTMCDTPVVSFVDDGAIVHELEAAGARVRAVPSGSRWILLRGSTIRRETVPSAGASPAMRRAEMLASGVLRDLGFCYELTANVSFSSLSGVSQFATGAKRGLGGWLPLVEPRLPELLVPTL